MYGTRGHCRAARRPPLPGCCPLFPHDGGDDRIRTGDGGFADPCLTAWRRRPTTDLGPPSGRVVRHVVSDAKDSDSGTETIEGAEEET